MEELNYTLKTENSLLKTKNEKLYKKTKNQKRTISRLKEIIEKQNIFLKKTKDKTIEEDEGWEDLDITMKEMDKYI